MPASLPLLLLLGLLFSDCGGAALDASKLGPVGPGQARILGTVVAVDTVRSARPADPCAQAPCYASVRVDSVFGYGSAFARPLSAGEAVRVRFGYTLGATEAVMPTLTPSYPGLAAGEAFLADVHAQAVPAPSPGGASAAFVVYGYHVVKR